MILSPSTDSARCAFLPGAPTVWLEERLEGLLSTRDAELMLGRHSPAIEWMAVWARASAV